jgi:HSP20 family protein
MFKIFSFGLNNVFNVRDLEKIGGMVYSFLDNIDISEFTEDNRKGFEADERKEDGNNDFIRLNQYEDMYVLLIDLKGVDLRELSIRYDPGVLEINLNRSEVEKRRIGILSNNILVKKAYNKKFENIEEIETNQILKSIDNGVLSIRMQKKYALESSIIDVEFCEDNKM